MAEFTWVSSLEASNQLGVSENTLKTWREVGYLKSGTHWRCSDENNSNKHSEFLYHLNWCKEEMEYWKSHHANIQGLVA